MKEGCDEMNNLIDIFVGYYLVRRYTFKEDVLQPYALVASGRRSLEVYETSRLGVKP